MTVGVALQKSNTIKFFVVFFKTFLIIYMEKVHLKKESLDCAFLSFAWMIYNKKFQKRAVKPFESVL